MYCGYMGVELPENWNFYLAFAFFRLAVVLQGRHRGSVAGEEPNQGTAIGTELPPCSSTAWSCSFCGVFPFLGELCRGQSWEPGAVSYRWSSQTFQLSTSLCQGIHWEVVRTRCCLSAHSRCGLGAFIRIKSDFIFTSLREEFPGVLLG